MGYPLPDNRLSDDASGLSISSALSRLEWVTNRLGRYGQILASLTILTVAGSTALAFFRVFVVLEFVFVATLVLTGLSAVAALLLSVLFESRRKEGDVLFKEISDELQWHVRFGRSGEDKFTPAYTAPEQRPGLYARLALRSFAQASNLPLVPGAYGPLLYTVINLLSFAFSAVSLLPSFRYR